MPPLNFYRKQAMINLDNRLKQCAEFVSGKGCAADVGTDHAYLAVHLITSGICKEVIACDLREGPLQIAKEHIHNEGLDGKIQTVLSDGLDNISPDGVSDVIIAGMGGELIARIISKAEWIKKNKVNLILQPMTKASELRKFLFQNGFTIKCEKAVKSEPFIYSVINAQYSEASVTYDDYEIYTGGLDFNSKLDREYLKIQANRLIIAGKGMLKSANKSENTISNGKEKIRLGNIILNRLKEVRKD